MKIIDNKPTKRDIIIEFTEEEAKAMELITGFLEDLGEALDKMYYEEDIRAIGIKEKAIGKRTNIFSELLLTARGVLSSLDDLQFDPDDIELTS